MNTDGGTNCHVVEQRWPHYMVNDFLISDRMAACAIVIFGVITWQLRALDEYIPVRLPGWRSRVSS